MSQLFDDGGLQAALIAAVVLSSAAFLARRALPVGWSSIAVAGSIVGLAYEHRVVPELVWALAVLAAAGWVAARVSSNVRGAAVAGAALAVPGGVVLAQAVDESASTWMRAVTVVAVVLAAPLAFACVQRASRLAPFLVLVTAIGILVCVPETGPVHCVIGALAVAVVYGVFVVVGEPPAAVYPLVGLLVWAAVSGGASRPGSVVGGIACFGVLAMPPLVGRSRPWLLVAVDVALVAFVARVAGFEDSALVALALVLAAFAVAVLALALALALTARRSPAR